MQSWLRDTACCIWCLTALLAGIAAIASEPEVTDAHLEQQLTTASEAEQVPILNELARRSWRTDQERARELAGRALDLATSFNDLHGQAIAHKTIAQAYLSDEQYRETLTHMEQAERLFVQVGEDVQAARALGYQGMALSSMGRLWPAIDVVQRALAQFKELDDKTGIAAATNNLGIYSEAVGEYEDALRYNLESLQLEESLGRPVGIANNLNSIGNIYSRLEDHIKARDYYQRALELFTEIGDRVTIGKVLNNIGNTYKMLDDHETAIEYLQRALDLARETGSRTDEADALNNLGIVHKKRRQYPEALDKFRAVAAIRQELGEQAHIAHNSFNIAEVLFLQQQYRPALAYLEKARAIGLETESNEILDGVYQLSATISSKMSDYRTAYDYQVLYSETRAKMLDVEKNRKLVEMQERYDAEKRSEQIKLLTADNELLKKDAAIRQLELTRTRLLAALLVSLVVLVVGAAVLLLRRYRYLLAFWKKKTFIGHYRVHGEITTGGMGIVYRATNVLDPSRTVALKVIREDLAGDEVQRQRFINEGRIIDELDHPNIVKVYERGEHNQRLYIAMEYLEGQTLTETIDEAISSGSMVPLPRCLAIIRQLLEAMVAIHARGIVHRDIKPMNVIVTGGGEQVSVKLLDFGIAKLDSMTTLTETGEILGTVHYLAPERIRHQPPTAASDVFSLGVLCYELLTLEKPFLAEEPVGVIRQLLEAEPLAPQEFRPELGGELGDLVLSMLRKEPVSRPDSHELLHWSARLGTAMAPS